MSEHHYDESIRDDERAKYMHDKCKQYKNYHVLVETKDGKKFDAIIMGVKKDKVELLVPQMMEPESYDREDYRQPRFRRFGGLLLPLAGLAALSLVPYFAPYPYPYYY
ncbi:hypothetical protein ACTWQL_18975 [Pseudalkalibacillus sp. R45]|uniref:hypothetical protein n=1 Tax=Pseudalkalibacillus sp. R45 TaxID=3457433 RepID=UPI003FCDADFE